MDDASTTLAAVLYQTLIPRADGAGRIVAMEVMIANDAIRNLIRDGKTPQMMSVIQTGSKSGMQTLDQAVAERYHRGLVSADDALSTCRDLELANRTINGAEASPISGSHHVRHDAERPLVAGRG